MESRKVIFMKKMIGHFLFAFFVLICFNAMVYVKINKKNFPDDNFRQYILDEDFDSDKNGILSDFEIEFTWWIRCENKDIHDLTGIEFFPYLETLNCSDNPINTLDLSNNKKLKYISCYNTNIKELNVRNIPLLEDLNCAYLGLTSLDVSNNLVQCKSLWDFGFLT